MGARIKNHKRRLVRPTTYSPRARSLSTATSFLDFQMDGASASKKGLIALIGFWPPTDIGHDECQGGAIGPRHGILWKWRRDEKGAATVNKEGYDIMAFSPSFEFWPEFFDAPKEPKQEFWGSGAGDFRIDYQRTSHDFWKVLAPMRPSAILSFGRAFKDVKWWLEGWAKNLQTDPTCEWLTAIPRFTAEGARVADFTVLPPIPGGAGNDYSPYTCYGWREGKPPDPTYPANERAQTNEDIFPRGDMVKAIQGVLDASRVDPSVHNGNPGFPAMGDTGKFLCEYMCYHMWWYVNWCKLPGSLLESETPCRMAGFTHVGGLVSPDDGAKAVDAMLDVLIQKLQKV
jgi:hypothetical protein